MYRFHILVAMTLIPLTGFAQSACENLVRETRIHGVVSNFEDPYELPVMELHNFLPLISEWNTYSCFIEDDDTFSFEFELLYPTNISIIFKEGITMYVRPGDSIFIWIDAGIISDTIGSGDIISKYSRISKYVRISSPAQSSPDKFSVSYKIDHFLRYCKIKHFLT